MQDHQPRQLGSGGGAVRRWTARLLVVAGAAMLVCAAFLAIDARLGQDAARRSLELVSRPPDRSLAREAPDNTALVITNPVVIRGSPIAELMIPRVGLSSVVLHGSDASTLRRGPGHLENTPLPGEAGNVAIAGHRDTFFRRLREVRLGDDIFLNTPHGEFHYAITSTRVVAANDLSVLRHTSDSVLTLITCYPFWVLGPAPDRFVVQATRVEEVPSVTPLVANVLTVHLLDRPAPTVTRPIDDGTAVPPVVHDDRTLIRLAVERFRSAYNSMRIKQGEAGLLRLSACEVAIAGDQATATCQASIGDGEDLRSDVRTFTVERTDSGWTLRSTANGNTP